MTDRELLELAAKAAGLHIIAKLHPISLYIQSEGCRDGVHWNPLADDGDALRLAVDLSLDVEVLHNATQINYDVRGILYHCNVGNREGDCNGDSYAATRRAIVRAAAEIGKAMK